MLSLDLLLIVCLGYVAALFALAFWVDRRARQGQLRWMRSPVIYTLSISIYCTAWTFYGAVGSAARSGLEFVTIYLGPTLVFVGWWTILRKLVRIGRVHRITSIADLISSRYGKSSTLAVLVTLIAVVAVTPYIALQLQSVTRSYEVIAGHEAGGAAAFLDRCRPRALHHPLRDPQPRRQRAPPWRRRRHRRRGDRQARRAPRRRHLRGLGRRRRARRRLRRRAGRDDPRRPTSSARAGRR